MVEPAASSKATTRLAGGPLVAGRYAFRRELGRGATGRVLLVADESEAGALRAMKVVPPEEAARLRWEFDLLAGIAHPNVARVYELLRVSSPVPDPFRLERGDAALVEQYVEGESADRRADALADQLDRRVRFVVEAGACLARALAAIHAAGMVHGDVKPQNLVVADDGFAVLIDLGLARPPGASSQIGGTPGYMAPEAWQGERSVATDLYGLGATLHRLLVGRAPGDDGQARSVAEVVERAMSRWRAGVQLPPGVPPALGHLMESLIDPAPPERPASAREVVGRLAAVAADLAEAAGERPSARTMVSAAGADDVPSPAERAMTVRALPWVGSARVLEALVAQLRAGAVAVVAGPHGSGRSRLVAEAIRVHQARCAEHETSVPTALRLESRLPSEVMRHDAVIHVEGGDAVEVAEAVGLVRAAELEGRKLAIVLERRHPPDDLEATVELGPLPKADFERLVSAALGGTAPSRELLEAARRASGGLAGRLCRVLADALAEGRNIARPDALADPGVVRGEAGELGLSPAARETAELVAVAGGELDPEDVVRALGGVGRFDLLVADGLAVLTERGRLHLRDDVARAVRRSIGPARRRSLAGRLDRARLDAAAEAFVLAAAGDTAPAVDAFVASVRRLRRLGSVEGAARLAADGLAELERESTGRAPSDALRPLRLARADALRALGRYAAAEASLEGVAGPEADILRAEVARLGGQPARAAKLAQEVCAGDAAPALRIRGETLVARLAYDAGRLDEALARADAAREQAVADGLDPEAARALEIVALVHQAQGHLEPTARAASEAVGRARRGGDTAGEARARSIAANVALRTGRIHAAARGHVDAYELAEAAGEVHAAATFLVNVGLARLDAGEPGPAMTALREGARRLARLGRERDLARTLYNLANAAALVGDDDLAEGALSRAVEVATRAHDAPAAAWAAVIEAELALRRGAPERAREAAARAESRHAELADPTERVVLSSRLVVVWLALEDEVAAHGAMERAREAIVAAAGDAVAEVEWHVAEVRAALHGRETQGAKEHAMGAWAAAERSGSFEMRLRAGFALADASLAVGDRQAATQALSEARAVLDAAANTLEPPARARMRVVPAYRRAFVEVPDVRAAHGGGEGRWRQLASCAKRLAAEQRVGRLYEAILEAAIELTGAERGNIVVRDEDGGVRVRVARGMDRRELAREEQAVSHSIVARAFDTGRTVSTVDALRDEELGGAASVHALDLRSVLAVPLRVRGDVKAVIYLEDRLRPGAFGPEDVELVSDLSEMAAVALEGAERLRAERRAARRVAALRRQLERTVQTQALELASLKRSTEGVPFEGSGIVAHSPAMRSALRLAQKVAASEVPVLITGESGTGKELVARAIHSHGARGDHPFVAENCSAIPETLLESMLFGHVRGAFTGADRTRMGLFEAAHGGTLFLDEIGEMSPAMQAKLLRVVQSGEVRPVGSERIKKVDVRLLTATHRDLAAMVREGTFREDLYYRLAVVTVSLPPLRERPEDVEPLVAWFVSKHAADEQVRLHPGALACLRRHSWPGNVRQLENEIQRAIVLTDGVIREEHLSDPVRGLEGAAGDGADALDLKAQVDGLERRLIQAALERTGGNQTRAAKLLGVSRYGLQKMIKRLFSQNARNR